MTPSSSSSSSSSSSFLTSIVPVCMFLTVPIFYYQLKRHKKKTKKNDNNTNNGSNDLSTYLQDSNGKELRPPFPQVIRDMLSKCQLAYLSTVDNELGSSHLSLMRFTYLNDIQYNAGEIMILSTNRKTKKFDMLLRQNGVALLVHDFGHGQTASSSSSSSSSADEQSSSQNNAGLYTITLNGTCRIVNDPIKSEYYRNVHLQHNPNYPQFIVGNDIAILCVYVTSARICDINDSVTKWDISTTQPSSSSSSS